MQLKELIVLLNEELKYRDNIVAHCKNIEASLWGLEEQSKFPENSSQSDQIQLNTEINKCRAQLINCQKLILSHESKVIEILKNTISPPTESGGCSGCVPS